MNKKWELFNYNEKEVNNIAKENNVNLLLATVLSNKGIKTKKTVELFLEPTRNDFHNPFLMPDMDKAVKRILKAIKEQENVVVYGDYDADGITSITVLKQFLLERGLEVDSYIPNRLDEGYGLNKAIIKRLKDKGYTLIITVDCGISGNVEIEYAKQLGLEVIVTDHHEPINEIPKCLAVVDAKRKDSKYPFNQLAGVGVIFKIIQAISIKLNLDEKEFLKYLDIVCIGTISDIVPLIDENRVIAKLGLKLIQITKNIGLRTLIDSMKYKEIDSNNISFGIAPRINACGRMGAEQEPLKLFLTKNKEEAKNIVQNLNQYNNIRQQTEKVIFEQAVEQIEKEQKAMPCIILAQEGWHHGVIGIVASKITDIYFKPSILIGFDGENGKGSGRSPLGIDLHKVLTQCSTYIEKFGGHSMAIGLNIKKENFNNFKKELQEYAQIHNICDIIPVVKIDKEITLKQIDIQKVRELDLLEPYGEGNEKPIFLIKNLRIQSIRTLSSNKHLKLNLIQDNYLIDTIGFNMGRFAENYKIGDKIDIIGNLGINKFRELEQLQINLKDFRKSIN